jgi:hypothetical protein
MEHTMNRLFGALLALAFVFVAVPSSAVAQEEMVGDWVGSLDAGAQGQLKIVFHVVEDADGKLDATLDSPDQGAFGIEAGPVTVDGDVISIEVPAVAGGYEGTISEDGDGIDGNWSQGGQSLPLPLKRVVKTENKGEGGR